MDSLYLVPAIVGLTSAIRNQFPSIKGLAPFIAFVVAIALYYAQIYMPGALFTLLMVTGSAMGIYTLADKVGTATVK